MGITQKLLARNQNFFSLIFFIPLNILKKKSLANEQRLIYVFIETFHCIIRKQRKNYQASSAFVFPLDSDYLECFFNRCQFLSGKSSLSLCYFIFEIFFIGSANFSDRVILQSFFLQKHVESSKAVF